jgi:hypothetical protein
MKIIYHISTILSFFAEFLRFIFGRGCDYPKQIKYFLLFVIFIPLNFVSCRDKKVVEAERIVKEWIGKEILFPDIEPTVLITVVGDSLKRSDRPLKEYKILFYADSAGCTSCKLRLSLWKTYIEELDAKVDFLFYFQPKREKDLLMEFRREQFTCPVYIDSKNELNFLNKFPDNAQYQCFLLDKDNKVVSIGNPTGNTKIWELYKQTITGKVSDKVTATTVETEQTEITLKDLKVGKTSEAVFVLKNTGTKPLVIQQVESSCGCTVSEWKKQPIAMGKSTEIRVKITPDSSEYFNKTVTVHCNTEKGQVTFNIKGTVHEE